MITDIIINIGSSLLNLVVGLFPTIDPTQSSLFSVKIASGISFILTIFGQILYVFPWMDTVFKIMFIWIIYNAAKFIIFIITWAASSMPRSPVNKLDLR